MQGPPVFFCHLPLLTGWSHWSALNVVKGHLVNGHHTRARAGFNRHITEGHSPFHCEGPDRRTGELQSATCRSRRTNLAYHRKSEVLCSDARLGFAVENHAKIIHLLSQ